MAKIITVEIPRDATTDPWPQEKASLLLLTQKELIEKINIERVAVGNTNVLNTFPAGGKAIVVDKLIITQAKRDAPVIHITSDLTKIGTYVTTQPIDGDDIEDATQAQNEAALEGIHRYRNAGTVPLLYYVYIFLILLCCFCSTWQYPRLFTIPTIFAFLRRILPIH